MIDGFRGAQPNLRTTDYVGSLGPPSSPDLAPPDLEPKNQPRKGNHLCFGGLMNTANLLIGLLRCAQGLSGQMCKLSLI
jgi:hypothetical protein